MYIFRGGVLQHLAPGLYTCKCFLGKLVAANDSCIRHGVLRVLTADSSAAGPLGNRLRALLGWRALPARAHLTPAWSHRTAPHEHEYFVRQLCITALYKGHSMLAIMLDGSGQVSHVRSRWAIRSEVWSIRHRPGHRHLQHRSNCSS